MKYRFRILLVLLSLLSMGWGAAGCSNGSSQSAAKEPRERPKTQFPVEVVSVEARRVEYTVSAVGSVEAFEQVQVTARVAGVVEKVHFAEGENVKAGHVLIEIEPERFRLGAESARAALEKAEAQKADAEAGLARRESVDEKNPGLIIGEELETWRTRVRTVSAEVAQARSALNLAELNLRDAFVKAPVPGVIQTRTVQTGQYVQPGAVLATLVQRDPLLLRFEVPEQDAARLKVGMRADFSVRGIERNFVAKISHVAESADPATRMVLVTGRINDEKRDLLRPGAFAEVRVPVGGAVEAPVIPQTAVRPSERGFLAFVVEGETVKERSLTLGMRTLDGLVEVRKGVAPGEKLVIRGTEALRDGAQVRVVQGNPSSAPSDARPSTPSGSTTPGAAGVKP
ncbi:MAG: efflux RND transporter periplasmic adaptor subunit [Candidatus Manganitrophus sp.]|nr:efflux RND transporter periplasmic adaptor subunit [Candidatus Manganitrophus sp.]